MRDLFLSAIFLSYLLFGLRAPFVLGLGYVWVDFMDPQRIAYSFLTTVPVSFIMAAAAALAFLFLAPKRNGPRIGLALCLFVIWAAWITYTTYQAEVPQFAWEKWNWAFKTVCFAAFLPFLFRTRVQLEALLLTIALAVSAAALAGAAKTVVTGGGYHLDLGLFRGNSGISEGSTLACICIAIVPLLLYLHQSGTFFKNRRFSFMFYYGLAAAFIIVSIGTFERTALVSLAVLAILLFPSLKHKYIYAALIGVAVLTSGYFLSDRWFGRMQTIESYQTDISAMTRIAVWSWTLNYVQTHPMGGGFDVYRIDRVNIPLQTPNGAQTDTTVEQTGRAFHSSWFEVLGEQGFPGMAIYLAMIGTFFVSSYRTSRRSKSDPELNWANALSRSLRTSATVYLVGGSFVGIAFQPFLYDIFAAGIVVSGWVWRAQRQTSAPAQIAPAWRVSHV